MRWSLSEHPGKPTPSAQISKRFVQRLHQYAEQHHIPMVRCKSGKRRWEETRTAELERKVGRQTMEIDFLKGCLQRGG